MLEKIRAYIKENGMLERRDKLVVGVSGGADSVCLFFVLLLLQQEYELELTVVHVNHGIRGTDADEDEAFVEQLAKQKGVRFEAFHVNIPQLAKEKGIGEEEAGRWYRYEVMEQVRKKLSANKIAVAHNENDCAETMLQNLFRGSGLAGLSGIAPKRERIIRPLLCVSRKEIEDWLAERQISYRTDWTNFCDEYTRNRVRLHFLPMAEREINERATEHTAKAAIFLREAWEYMEKQIKEAYNRNVSEKNGVYFIGNELPCEEPVIQKGVIKLVLERLAGSRKDLESAHVFSVQELFKKQVGKEVHLPYQMKAKREYLGVSILKENGFLLEEKEKEQEYECIQAGEYFLPDGRSISFEIVPVMEKITEIPKNNCTKWFDYDRIKGTLSLRHRKTGDYLQIKENGGKKKLKDELIDRKIPKEERDKLWLLTEGSHVMWILGGRTSEAYRITAETVSILKVKLSGGNDDEC